MALAVVQGPTTGGSTASTSSVAATYGSTTGGGNLLVVLITRATGAAVSGVADSASNTWVQAGTTLSNVAGGNDFDIWYAKNATANAGTVTATLGSAAVYRNIALYEVSGADTSAPYDTSSTGSGSGAGIATGTLTLATANEIILAMAIGTEPITVGTGYTGSNYAISGDANKYFLAEYHIVTSNEAATASQSNAQAAWGIIAAAFKQASGGGATRPVKMAGRWGGYAGRSGGFAA